MATVSGTTKDFSGSYVSRLVRVYRKDTGAFVGEIVSNPTTGVWSITVPTTATKYFAVQQDGDASESWNYLVSGIHFDNDTGIVDVKGRSLSVSGVSLSSSQSLFGGYSGYFNGSSHIVIGGTTTDFDAPGDLTIDMAVYFGDTSFRRLLSCGGAGGSMAYEINGQVGSNINLSIYSDVYGYINAYGPAPSSGSFNRIRVIRNGNDHVVYTNGTPGTPVSSAGRPIPQTSGMYLGRHFSTGSEAHVGYIDDFFFLKGKALSTGSAYTPSASAFYDPRTEGSENSLIYDNLVAV